MLIVYVNIHREVCVDVDVSVEADANFDIDRLNLTKRKMCKATQMSM